LLGVEDRVVHAVQAPHHVHALVQIGVDLAFVSQHDGGMLLVLEQQRGDSISDVSSPNDQIKAG
jgi:hypothetical protein